MGFEKVKVSEEMKFYLEDVDKPVVIISLDGSIYKANDQFMDVFGVGEVHLLEEIISEQSLELWRFHVENIEKTQRITFHLNMKSKNTTEYSVTVNMLLCSFELKAVVLLHLPVTLRKVNEHQSLAFRKTDNLIAVTNADGYIKDINNLTYEFFDLPRDYFIGLKGAELFKLFKSDYRGVQTFIHDMKSSGRAEIILEYIQTSGEVRYYKVASFMDEDNNLCLTRVSDYTERAMLKKGLLEKNSLSEVGQLAASIAHEIRNPMTTLKGFTQLLKANATEDSLKYLTVIDEEIIRMESILSEMLYLAKPTVKEKKNIQFNQVVLDMICIISPKANDEGICIVQIGDFSKDYFVYGEEGKLKQVLLNLLKNGLEAMKPGGTLTITLVEPENNQVGLIIEDTGKGMYEAQLDQIFSTYFTTRSNGTGLGLPFVLKTVEDHGGTIKVSSIIHVGSKFVLSFPVRMNEHQKENSLKTSVLLT